MSKTPWFFSARPAARRAVRSKEAQPVSDPPLSRGFRGRRGGADAAAAARVPPGQHVTADFPVLSAGAAPRTRPEDWSFALQHGGSLLAGWSWGGVKALPRTRVAVDIH